MLVSAPRITSYVQRSPGRHSGADATDRLRSLDVDGAATGSGGRDWSMVTHAPLDTARSTSAARTRHEDIMKKSSHMCGGRRNNRGDAAVPISTLALTPCDEDRADKRDEGTDGKPAARELMVDQHQRQQDESPRNVR